MTLSRHPTYIALRSIRLEPGETPSDVPRERWESHRPLAFIRRYAPELARRLAPVTDARRVRFISVPRGRNGNWARLWSFLSPNDLTLFTGGGGVFAAADIIATGRSAGLGRALEKDAESGPFEYFIFLGRPRRTWVPYATLNKPVGFKPNYVVQGFNVIGGARSAALIQAVPDLLAVTQRSGV